VVRRTRFRPDFTFEVGRVKAVLGLEIDLMYGQGGPNDGGFPGNNTGTAGGVLNVVGGNVQNSNSGCKVNSNGCLDLNTDVGGMIEIKWIYTEFPLTGKDKLDAVHSGRDHRAGLAANPLVPWPTTKWSMQTVTSAACRQVTTFAPNLKTNVAFVIVEDQLAGATAPRRTRGRAAARTTRSL